MSIPPQVWATALVFAGYGVLRKFRVVRYAFWGMVALVWAFFASLFIFPGWLK